MRTLQFLIAMLLLATTACVAPDGQASLDADPPDYEDTRGGDDVKSEAARRQGPDVCGQIQQGVPFTDLSTFDFQGNVDIKRTADGQPMLRSGGVTIPITNYVSRIVVPPGATLTIEHEMTQLFIGELVMGEGSIITAPMEDCVEFLVCQFDAHNCFQTNIHIGFNKLMFDWPGATECIQSNPKLYQIVPEPMQQQQQQSPEQIQIES